MAAAAAADHARIGEFCELGFTRRTPRVVRTVQKVYQLNKELAKNWLAVAELARSDSWDPIRDGGCNVLAHGLFTSICDLSLADGGVSDGVAYMHMMNVRHRKITEKRTTK